MSLIIGPPVLTFNCTLIFHFNFVKEIRTKYENIRSFDIVLNKSKIFP